MTITAETSVAPSLTRLNPVTLPDAGAVGYSQITITEPGRLVFISGQVAWRRGSGAASGSLAEQVDLVVENARAALDAIGATPRDLAMVRVYLTDLRPETPDVVMPKLRAFFDGTQPSLTVIGVAALASPDLQLEMEMVVRLPA